MKNIFRNWCYQELCYILVVCMHLNHAYVDSFINLLSGNPKCDTG